MSTKDNTANKELSEMDVQETQAALAKALDVELAPHDPAEGLADRAQTTEEEGEVVRLEPRSETEQQGDQAALEDLFDMAENPFAAAAEFARQVRMAEALLFAAVEPLDEATLKDRLPEGSQINDIVEALQKQYENRGINLLKIGRKWQFSTAADVAYILEREQVQPRKLSRAALETLAIIAYHQPCTRAEIEEIRSVAVSKGSLDQLLELSWIRLRGRKEGTPGKPLLYGTSQGFLEHFGLQNISHLPGMADLKAAGLLDARLPPDFAVPVPEDGLSQGDGDAPAETDFVRDFHAPEEGDAVALDEGVVFGKVADEAEEPPEQEKIVDSPGATEEEE